MTVDLIKDCSCGHDVAACADKWTGRYFGDGAGPVAGIELSESFGSLMARVKNGKRDAKLADRIGCTIDVFDHASWRPDIVSIHHSKKVRSGGRMKGHYLLGLDEMGGRVPMKPPTPDACPFHWRHDWGIFAKVAGDTIPDKRLVGYIGLSRVGTTATYMQILGHGDWLKFGIMFRLHFGLMEWALSRPPELDGVGAIWYTDFRGAPGLATWKKKAGFQEVML